MSEDTCQPKNPHILPYAIACALIVGLPLVVFIGASIATGYADRAFADNIFLLAIFVFLPLSYLFEYVTASPRTHRICPPLASPDVREKLSRWAFIGMIGAVVMLEGVTGTWAILTQLIGGFVLVALFFAAFDTAFDWFWGRIKAMWKNR